MTKPSQRIQQTGLNKRTDYFDGLTMEEGRDELSFYYETIQTIWKWTTTLHCHVLGPIQLDTVSLSTQWEL